MVGHPSICFRNAWIVDDTGGSRVRGDVEVTDQRVFDIRVGSSVVTSHAAANIDATGLVLCPGFIDIQSHSIHSLLADG